MKRKKPVSSRTVPLPTCAEEIDVTPDTLQRYTQEGCPCNRGGRGKPNQYDPAEVMAWMKANGKTGKVGRPVDESLNDARLRKESAMAENWELRNKQILGETVNKEEYRRHWMSEVITIKNKCRGLGASVAPGCVGQDAGEIQGIIDTRVEQIFKELSE